MKSDTLNGILTFMLGVFVVAGVVLAVRWAMLTHELHRWQRLASIDQAILVQTQSVYADAAAYNQKYNDPRLAQILSTVVQHKPATR